MRDFGACGGTEWTVDGEDITDEVEFSPEFEAEVSSNDSSSSQTVEAGEVADFSTGLSTSTEYDVTVTEVEASMSEAPFDEPIDGDDPGRECDLTGVEYSPAEATVDAGAEARFDDLEDGATYTLDRDEVDPPEEFENATGETCTLNQDLSTTEGRVEFTADEDDAVAIDATNTYDCVAVEGEVEEMDEVEVEEIAEVEELPDTGANALWLTLLAMLGLGSGLALLVTRRNDGRQEV